MSYTAEISRANPTAFLFLIDQSGSMDERFSSTGKSKAEFVADVMNRTLANLIIRCAKSEGTRNYFDVGVIAYGYGGAINGLQGSLGSKIMNPISEIEANPLRIEERKRKMDDGCGGIVETAFKMPIWFEPKAYGGTPMCEALQLAAKELADWCDAHPNSYPPTILHITDGEANDGEPEPIANLLKQIKTDDGEVLMFNLHTSGKEGNSITFAVSEHNLPDDYAKMLFRMSSQLPPHIARIAQEKGFTVSNESRGYIFNAEPTDIIEFFDIGTRASQLR